MRISADLTIRLSDPRARRSLSEVLAPDNEGLPGGVRLSMAGGGTTLGVVVDSDSVADALSIVLALLRDIALFQEVWLLSRSMAGMRRQE